MTLSCSHPEGRRLPLQPYLSNLYGRNLISLICFTTVLVFSVAGVSSSGQEDDKCTLNPELTMDTPYGLLRFFEIPDGSIGIDFKVKASENARIFLFSTDIQNGTYAVVIGRVNDTQSRIALCWPCYHLTAVKTNDLLKQEEFRRFWIKFENNNITVGIRNEETPFMTWKLDPNTSNFTHLGYPTWNPAEYQFCKFVYDSEFSSPSPSVTSFSPSVSPSSDAFSKTASSTEGVSVEYVRGTSDSHRTSPSFSFSNYHGQTSHHPDQSLPGVSTTDEDTSSNRSIATVTSGFPNRTSKRVLEHSGGKVTLWPLAVLCIIPVIVSVAIYVTIKRKQATSSKQTAENSPGPVNELQPGKLSSSLQNGTSQYVLSDDTRNADTAMVDNVAYQSTEDFSVPSQGATSYSSINKNAYLTGDTIYNVAYESYSKPRGDTNAGTKMENGDSEYEYAY